MYVHSRGRSAHGASGACARGGQVSRQTSDSLPLIHQLQGCRGRTLPR